MDIFKIQQRVCSTLHFPPIIQNHLNQQIMRNKFKLVNVNIKRWQLVYELDLDTLIKCIQKLKT